MSNPSDRPRDDVSRPESGPSAGEASAARARPEYGEYATPQEQAAAIARSLPAPSGPPAGAGERSDAGSGRPGTGRPGWGMSGAAEGGRAPTASARPASARPASGRVDRFVTILLLALGLVYLLEGLPSYLAFGQALQTVFTQWGIGDYTPTPSTGPIGIAILVVQAIVWLATSILALRRLRRGRSSWWIALLGAVVSFLVTGILFATVLTSDPAFTTYLTSV